MKLSIPIRMGMIALVVPTALFSAGLAQTTTSVSSGSAPAMTTGHLKENANPTQLAARAPGKLVDARLARLQQTAPLPPVTISEGTIEPSIWDVIIESFMTAFAEFLQNFFSDLFGVPVGNGNSNDNTNGNDNSNTNDNTNSNSNDNTNENDNTNSNTNTNTNDNTNSNANENDNASTGRPPQTGVRKLGSFTLLSLET